jgi:hypothetical protein
MTSYEIEIMLSKGDIDILSPDIIRNIEKKEYPFVGKYIKSTNPHVRDVTISFLRQMEQPWCYPFYMISLNDPVASNRALTGQGILALKSMGKTEDLFAAIEKEKTRFSPEEWAAFPYLIQTIGNIANSGDIEKLKKTVGSVTNDAISIALHSALAKLGDEKAVHQIEESLLRGSPPEKMDALDIVNYLDNRSWIPKVITLLHDRSTAMSFEIGPHRVIKRVCDFAVNTLILIDTGKKIPLKPMEAFPYNDKDILLVKEMYGLKSGK